MNVSFRCKCGHGEEDHNLDPYSAFFGLCNIVIAQHHRYSAEFCSCKEYNPDNLRYLEDVCG